MANKKESPQLATIDIKGKAYVLVNERIKYFRETYPDGVIETEILTDSDSRVLMVARVFVDGVLRATGHAYEREASNYINKTSYIENCETSAVGRALAIFGIGIDVSVASAEEVANAIKQQENDKPISSEQVTALELEMDELDVDLDKFCARYGVKKVSHLTLSQMPTVTHDMKEKRKSVEKKRKKEADEKPIEEVNVADLQAESQDKYAEMDDERPFEKK